MLDRGLSWRRWLLCGAAALGVTGCLDDGDAAREGLEALSQPIVNGTREPTVIPLSEGEKLAIGWLHSAGQARANFCTGTLISPRIVITASHCTEGQRASNIGFGVGLRPAQPRATFQVAELYEHPNRDAAILILSEDVTSRVPELVPIPANRAALNSSLQGRTVEAAGYGDTRDANRDGRWFASLLLEQITQEFVVVNGQGVRGICFGDSGGPVLATDSQNRPIILGVESSGDESCVGRDYLTRLDAIVTWMDPITGLVDQPPEQRPQDNEPGEPEREPDSSEQEPTPPPADICDTLDFQGRCNGDTAEWCQEDDFYQRDCAALGTECRFINEDVGFICDCGDVSYLGRCNGNTAEYCDNGRLARVDCGDRGQSCGYVNDQTGYFCTDTPDCGQVDMRGVCAGTAIVTCADGRFDRVECADQGGACAIGGDGYAFCELSSQPPGPAPGPGGETWTDDESWADDDANPPSSFIDEGSQSAPLAASARCQAASPARQRPVTPALWCLLWLAPIWALRRRA